MVPHSRKVWDWLKLGLACKKAGKNETSQKKQKKGRVASGVPYEVSSKMQLKSISAAVKIIRLE